VRSRNILLIALTSYTSRTVSYIVLYIMGLRISLKSVEMTVKIKDVPTPTENSHKVKDVPIPTES
jgi:hypothetical protein